MWISGMQVGNPESSERVLIVACPFSVWTRPENTRNGLAADLLPALAFPLHHWRLAGPQERPENVLVEV